MRYVTYTDRKKVAADLRPVYSAANAEDAEHQLAAFDEQVGRALPDDRRLLARSAGNT